MATCKLPAFRNSALLTQALTHRSYANEHPEAGDHNERLEFLGDAVLNFLSGEFLYQRYPEKPEGELTALRSLLVDETQLAKFANHLGLGQKLRLGQGAKLQGGRANPNLTSCAFEALLGAYFLDQGSQVDAIRPWVIAQFETVVDELATATKQLNPKSLLQEQVLLRFQELPKYRITSESGPDHDKCFKAEVWVKQQRLGSGQGKRKQDAEKAAARSALAGLEAITEAIQPE